MRWYLKGILAFVSLGGIVSGGWVMAQSAPVKNIVLVHGAFADGSSWSKVIPLLQAKGYHVTSVAIPLTAFADDVAATKRAIRWRAWEAASHVMVKLRVDRGRDRISRLVDRAGPGRVPVFV